MIYLSFCVETQTYQKRKLKRSEWLSQEGLVDMDFGVLVWVAGVGMRPFTRALCEKIGKACHGLPLGTV